MAAAAASEVEGDLRIPQSFDEYTYRTWKDYVLQCVQQNIPIESPKIETLALLTLLCHKFTKGSKNYGKLFFELLCQALASLDDSFYRCRSRERRPQMFRDKPTAQVRKDYRFVWPVTFSTDDERTEAASTTFYAGIPIQYLLTGSQDAEETGVLCAIFYLVMSDTALSFKKLLQTRQETNRPESVEFPCLLSYFKLSPKNNQNQTPSLVGEYLAFINISLELEFNEVWSFTPIEQVNDFEVKNGAVVRKFSVKSDNRGCKLRYFDKEILDPSSDLGAGRRKNDPPANGLILILNCDCDHCKVNPVIALQATDRSVTNCQRSRALKELSGLSEENLCNTFLMSIKNYFDLRFAIGSFDNRSFRNEDDTFRSKRELYELFNLASSKSKLDDDHSCLRL